MTDLERLELILRRVQASEQSPHDVGELVDMLVLEITETNKYASAPEK